MSTVLELLPDLDAGRFLEKLDTALGAAAKATIHNGDKGKKGQVQITLTMERIGDSNQVTLTHAIDFTMPTLRGKRGEHDATQTPLHVGQNGKLTLMPDTQTRFQFDNEPPKPE